MFGAAPSDFDRAIDAVRSRERHPQAIPEMRDLSSRWPSVAMLIDARRRRETHRSGTLHSARCRAIGNLRSWCVSQCSSESKASPAARWTSADLQAVLARERRAAIRFNSAICNEKTSEAARPRLSWFTISKILSSSLSGGVAVAINLPVRRWAFARESCGIRE